MNKDEKNKLLKTNTVCWLTAMALPAVLHFSLAGTKFPWPVIVPLLLLGPMLASNGLLSKAARETTDASSRSGGRLP